VENRQVVNIWQVQRGDYQQLAICLKYCGFEKQIYKKNNGKFSKEETRKEEK